MGGIGSGRMWHLSPKNTTDSLYRLDVRSIKREGLLKPGLRFGWRWTHHGEKVASIQIETAENHVRLIYRSRSEGEEWEPMDYKVHLISQPCYLGGVRKWFQCPARGCGRRVAILFGGRIYACRHCHDLVYQSQRESPLRRYTRRSEALQARLGWETELDQINAVRPKWMHWRTYQRLIDELNECELQADLALAPVLQRLGGL